MKFLYSESICALCSMLFVLLGQSFDMCDVSPQNEQDTFANIVF
jgi:hypothetical protein